jgi:tRNA modification GTPase
MSAARETIAAQLTPSGRGAVATVAVRGPQAWDCVARYFVAAQSRRSPPALNDIAFGRWQRDATSAGEELVVCRTSEHDVEIHCHGGAAAAEAILDDLVAVGARRTTWQEWIALSKTDAIAQAALIALADARTERTAGILLDQYRGALDREMKAVAALLEHGDLSNARKRIQQLLDRWSVGEHLTRPFRVVLAGPPNVGKSSLINALVGYERSIVFDQPGTTRDVVTALTAFDGWPVELSDTAGLRVTSDPLEASGVDRARAQLDGADLVLWVRECTLEAFVDPTQQPPKLERPPLLVYNKSDLADSSAPQIANADHLVSAVTRHNLDALQRAIVERLVPTPPQTGDAVPFVEEHRHALLALWQETQPQ